MEVGRSGRLGSFLGLRTLFVYTQSLQGIRQNVPSLRPCSSSLWVLVVVENETESSCLDMYPVFDSEGSRFGLRQLETTFVGMYY